MPSFDQDDVAPFLPDHLPSERFKNLYGFLAAHSGKRGHQAYTSTWRVSMVSGKPCSAEGLPGKKAVLPHHRPDMLTT